MSKTWILYIGDNPLGSNNNSAGAIKIGNSLQILADFFKRPNLRFGTKADIPPQGDLNHTTMSVSLVMDDGTQLNVHAIVDKPISSLLGQL